MSAALDQRRESTATNVRDLRRWVIPAAVVIVVALRLPHLGDALTPDEAGFMSVGSQWHAGGTSLYGNLWVDRPPLLISLFQFASALGGAVPLRLLGCFAAALIVLGSSVTAGMIADRRAARWAAIAAAALCSTPVLGTAAVNGELLGSPFIVGGIAATVAALRAPDQHRARLFAMAAGASGLGAILVKQNLGDVFVFGLIATLIAWRRGDINGRRCVSILAWAVGGVLIAGCAIAFWTLLRGTSLLGVFDAMYPFRLTAGHVIADGGGSQFAQGRLLSLIAAFVASGMAVLFAAVLWSAATRRLRDAAGLALTATLAFDAFSIAFGGGYWSHYLVQPIVPLAILTGILVPRRQPLLRPVIAVTVLASLISWAGWVSRTNPSMASTIGHTIAASAEPGDTLVTAYGHPDVGAAAQMTSPYRYLWSLPIKTLDPQLRELNVVLTGPQAPTWFVVWHKIPSWGLESGTVQATIAREYQPFADICGRTVYLRDGISRPALTSPSSCRNASALGNTLKRELP